MDDTCSRDGCSNSGLPSKPLTMEGKFKHWLETEEGRHEINDLYHKLQVTARKNEKSEEICLQLKSKGSEAFVDKRIEDAHLLYSAALQKAPSDSATVPLLYGNRSAALFEMNRFENCLADIENAESFGFPMELKCKLLIRKIRCLVQLSRREKSLVALEELREVAAKTDAKGVHAKSISTLSDACQNVAKSDCSSENNEFDSMFACLHDGESERVRNMSKSLEIRSNPEEGRYVVTNTKIPKGSVLVVEKPFAAILLAENSLTHCQMCLNETYTPIPCEWCCSVIFCSLSCRTSAIAFHRYECPILHMLSRFPISHLALRLLLVAELNTCTKVRNEVGERRSEDEETKVGATREEQYRAVYSRVTHMNKLTPEDELNYATVAITLTEALLDKTCFIKDQFNNNETSINFNRVHSNTILPNVAKLEISKSVYNLNGNSESILTSEDFKNRLKIELSCILMHHITLVISNGHGIDEYRKCPKDSDELSPVVLKQIASAIYPSASLMNHSCKIYTMNSFINNVLVIQNIEDLSPGDQVYTCYGPHFGEKSVIERQRKLEKQYFFECRCIACTHPSYIKEEEKWTGLKCPICAGTAICQDSDAKLIDLSEATMQILETLKNSGTVRCTSSCGYSDTPSDTFTKQITQVVALNNEALELLAIGELTRAKINLIEAMNLGTKIFDPKSEFLNTMRKTLSKTLAQCGEVESCLRELLLFLEYIKYRHGSESTTTAFEMIRILGIVKLWKNYGYSNLMATEEMEEKIYSIFKIHYGKRWRNFVKIDRF